VKIVNKKAFYEKLNKRLGIVPVKNAQRACFKAANLVKNEAQKSILAGNKTGPVVTRYNPKRTIAISAPGEPPASDTGFLASNITSEVRTVQGNQVFGIVRSTAPYSAFLEFGTTKMAARPFLQPALDKSANKIKRIFEKEGMIS
jgi:HK97 gp10 family phage protein